MPSRRVVARGNRDGRSQREFQRIRESSFSANM
jgi:hypothetical protein